MKQTKTIVEYIHEDLAAVIKDAVISCDMHKDKSIRESTNWLHKRSELDEKILEFTRVVSEYPEYLVGANDLSFINSKMRYTARECLRTVAELTADVMMITDNPFDGTQIAGETA